MLSALIAGTLGIVGIGWVATQVLDLSLSFAVAVVLVTFLGSFVALLVTMRLSEIPRLRVTLKGWPRQWGLLVGSFLAIFFGMLPEMWDLKRFLWLVIPMLASMGYTVIAFGPIQDRHVRKKQKLRKA